jgi:hypothetical protein
VKMAKQHIDKLAVAKWQRAAYLEAENNALSAAEDAHWHRVKLFLQYAYTLIDYLLCRVYAKLKLTGEDLEPLFAELAEDDGPLNDELIVRHIEAIARSARDGFVDVDGFLGSMEWSRSRKGGDNGAES